jgi:hypothetical protein
MEQGSGTGPPTAPLPISQIAIVVRDIDEALERYHQALDWGPGTVRHSWKA